MIRRLARILPIVAACSASAVAQDSRPDGYRTFLESVLLDKAPRIVRARFHDERDVAGVQATAYVVTSVLRGAETPRVLVGGAGPASEASRATDKLLFLRPLRSGVLHELVDMVEAGGDAGRETETFVRRALALSELRDVLERRRALKRLIFDGLRARGEFARKLGAREFVRASVQLPGLFQASDLPELRAASQRLPDDERLRFKEALGALANERLEGFAGVERTAPDGPDRELFLLGAEALNGAASEEDRAAVLDGMVRRFGKRTGALLVAAIQDRRADVRREALRLAGILRVPEAGPPALALFRKATGAEKAAAAECLGRLGEADAAAALGEALDLKAPEAEILLVALARLETPVARAYLVAAARRLADEGPAELARAVAERMKPTWRAEDSERRDAEAKPYLR
ncbi:MAG TPA: hypothetical protein VEI02_05355 [Planctomycetota bacterium]|nr:hypothetical protein [Planctomycetota bacterium]